MRSGTVSRKFYRCGRKPPDPPGIEARWGPRKLAPIFLRAAGPDTNALLGSVTSVSAVYSDPILATPTEYPANPDQLYLHWSETSSADERPVEPIKAQCSVA